MTNPVSTSDLEARWRTLSAEETGVAEAMLEDAWVILLSRSPGLEDRITAGTLDTSLVIAVVSAMVLRVMRNPDGNVSETIGNYSYQRANVAAAGLFITPEELALISPSGVVPYGAFTIRQIAVPVWSP